MALSLACKTVAALSLASVGLASLVGWSPTLAQAVPPAFLPLQMSLNRLMVAVVDDAAHGIWAGGNKNEALTDSEWVEIEMNTYQLQAAATLVSIGGTGPADRGWATSPGFQERARKLNDMAVSARSAVTGKNQVALRSVGDTLVDVCNECHDVFKPGIPTEGIFLKRGHGY
jgi:hypothetical protein